MKIRIKIEKEVKIVTLQVNANVRYWEDGEINGEPDTDGNRTPCRDGSLWQPFINIDNGQILNWKQGITASIHYKVCDCCGWEIKDEADELVLSAEDGYVPDTLCPKENGYGDYIIMDIDENGFIKDWDFNIEDFQQEED